MRFTYLELHQKNQYMRFLPFFLISLSIVSSCITPLSDKDKYPEMVIFATYLEHPDSLMSENPNTWNNLQTVVEGRAFSGTKASKLDQSNEFSVVYEQKFGYIAESTPKRVTFNAMIYAMEPFPTGYVVASIGTIDYYRNYPITEFVPTANKWEKVSATFTLPDSLKPSDKLKVYLWNKKKSEFWADDISLEFEF